jgi:PIN domain nuclease of toxin-antitoxin system
VKLLLDTHVFLWLRNEPEKIPLHIMNLYEDMRSDAFLSMASIWEMQIKNQLGKLALDIPLNELIDQQCLKNGLQILAIETTHIYALKNLPAHHNDPFDRLILTQAQTENLTLISADSVFKHYDVDCIW